jgi:hypothetical protein
LERFAAVLERHGGPMTRLARLEHITESERLLLRADESPLTIAYRDPALHEQGLAGDRVGDAMAFREAHYLLCDCHYNPGATPTPEMMATRVRAIARKKSFGEVVAKIRSILNSW